MYFISSWSEIMNYWDWINQDLKTLKVHQSSHSSLYVKTHDPIELMNILNGQPFIISSFYQLCLYRMGSTLYWRNILIGSWSKKNYFKCDICDYSCSRKNHMNIHFATVHEGKKPIKHDIWQYSCFDFSDMKRNAANFHEGKKPFIFMNFLPSFIVSINHQ